MKRNAAAERTADIMLSGPVSKFRVHGNTIHAHGECPHREHDRAGCRSWLIRVLRAGHVVAPHDDKAHHMGCDPKNVKRTKAK
jgi:hypothetical protein